MTLRTLLEVYAIYFVGAFLVCLAVVVRCVNSPLDGSPRCSVLDDRDRTHMVAVATAHEQPLGLFAASLDEIQGLPECEPWKRFLP